ncbi:hypothetical protein B9Z55_004266 [Caenorhabditis nigoni]|uniref:G-protein coupled receptors family 1 profile domain-containing protein n=1 Tax=Caenorhabditis nigoni TaxID=1611254 RepID=A0A2G5UWF3_9PELO|nr:hypothetical protein B9Z55_004266 [Caenorhabditis nigoni]
MDTPIIYGLTNDTSCPFRASPDQMILQTSWILRMNIIYCTFLSIGCVVGVGYCIRFMRKHPIFNESTTLLLYLALLFALIHDTAHVGLQWSLMYRSFVYSDDPCRIFFFSDDCVNSGRTLFFGISGLIYIHSALTLDGLIATFLPSIYYKYHSWPGRVLAVLTIIVNIFVQFLVLPGKETGDDYLPSCQFFKKQDAEKANLWLMSSIILTISSLLINLGLLYVNKMHSKRTDYLADDESAVLGHYLTEYDEKMYRTRYDVQFQYQRSEAIMTSKSISVLVIAQISALLIYAGGSYIFRLLRESIPVSLYNNVVIWVYATSYATVTLPLLIIFCIKYVRRHRQRTIHHITNQVESQEKRMNELKMLWE